MNGCHSTLAPDNRKHAFIELPKYIPITWEYRFTRTCQYDKKHEDKGCEGCKDND